MKFWSALLATAVAQTTTAAATTAAASGDLDEAKEGIKMTVQGQSGKMTFENENDSGKKIQITMDGLYEMAADGTTAVGTGGQGAHSFNSFASQSFTISALEETTLEGAACWKTSFTSTINGGDFIVTIYLMKEDVTITNGDEEIEIPAGQAKFTIEVNNWAWCDETMTDTSSAQYCAKGQTRQTGAFLDFKLAIKGPQAPSGSNPGKKTTDSEPATVDLGDGVSISLSTKVKVDDAWQNMPGADEATDYYPKVETQGSSTVYTFRFPKGAKLFYDPSIDVGASGTSSAAVAGATALLLGGAALL